MYSYRRMAGLLSSTEAPCRRRLLARHSTIIPVSTVLLFLTLLVATTGTTTSLRSTNNQVSTSFADRTTTTHPSASGEEESSSSVSSLSFISSFSRRLADIAAEASNSDKNDSSTLICQLQINRILPPDGRINKADEEAENQSSQTNNNSHYYNREFCTCSPWYAHRGGLEGVYRITPPAELLAQYRPQLLSLDDEVFLVIVNGRIEKGEIVLTSNGDHDADDVDAQITVLLNPPDRQGQRHRRRQLVSSTGAARTVMLRVRMRDAEPSFSVPELQRYLVTDPYSAKRQFERCSQNQLTLDTSQFGGGGGVIDVYIDKSIAGMSKTDVMGVAETYVNDVILKSYTNGGIDNIREWSDFLMFIIPPGTGGWAAFATVAGKQSVYNDKWGGYLGGMMHEMGHNIGLDHAFQDGVEYAGATGYMGDVPSSVLAPLRCYNAHNHYMLKWFADRELEINPNRPRLVTLAPFVHYQMSAPNEYVVVHVGDLYMQYNRAIDYNVGSAENQDQLVIVKDRGIGEGTDLLVGLSVGQEYTERLDDDNRLLRVNVCSRSDGNGLYGADIITISIGYGGSLCNNAVVNRPPPPAPTPPAVPAPGPPRTPAPTPFPSPLPTPIPTLPPQPAAPVSPPSTTTSPQQEPTIPTAQEPSPPPQSSTGTVPSTTSAPTIVVGDDNPTLDRDNNNVDGIGLEQLPLEAPEKKSGLVGILASSLGLVAALLLVLVVYLKCFRKKKPDRSNKATKPTKKEKEIDVYGDVEKASVHSDESDTTSDASSDAMSDEDSVDTDVAAVPASDTNTLIAAALTSRARSFAHSFATSCALASGTAPTVNDQEVDEDVDTAITGLMLRRTQGYQSGSSQVSADLSANARGADPRNASPDKSNLPMESAAPHDTSPLNIYPPTNSETFRYVRPPIVPKPKVKDSPPKAEEPKSWLGWMGLESSFTPMSQSSPSSSSSSTPATCDLLTSICGLGRSPPESTVVEETIPYNNNSTNKHVIL